MKLLVAAVSVLATVSCADGEREQLSSEHRSETPLASANGTTEELDATAQSSESSNLAVDERDCGGYLFRLTTDYVRRENAALGLPSYTLEVWQSGDLVYEQADGINDAEFELTRMDGGRLNSGIYVPYRNRPFPTVWSRGASDGLVSFPRAKPLSLPTAAIVLSRHHWERAAECCGLCPRESGVFQAISEFPKWRKYLISLSFRGQSSVRPVQVGGFDVNIVIHRSTAVRGRGGPARHDAWPPSLGAILAHTDGPCGS